MARVRRRRGVDPDSRRHPAQHLDLGFRTSGPRPRPGHAVDEPLDDVRHHRDGRRGPVSHLPEHLIVRYDPRGVGSSGGEQDFSVQAQARDLADVVAAVTPRLAVIFAPMGGAPVALAYAAEHPKSVELLVLWCGYARGSDFFDTPRMKAALAALRYDLGFVATGLARDLAGRLRPDLWEQTASLRRDLGSPKQALAAVSTSREVDVTPILGRIRCPTVVLHRRGVCSPPIEAARRMAGQIPNSRLVILEGDALFPTVDGDQVREALEDALANPPSHGRTAIAPEQPAISPRRLRVLELAAEGRTNDEIAERLYISSSTVKKHLQAVFREFGASNRAGAIATARRLGILE